MQLDAFPETRCPRELELLQRGKFRALEQAYRDAAQTILIKPGICEVERERRHRELTQQANEYAAVVMDRELPWPDVKGESRE